MTGKVLVVFETMWDRPQLAAMAADPAGAGELGQALFAAPRDADVRWDLDVVGWVAEEARRWRGAIDGVFSASDYPGSIAAAALAAELDLPGPRPEAVLRAAHKHLARLAQREVAPEAVPPFALVDPDDPRTWHPPFGFPCFAKPVKGTFSVLARAVADHGELARHLGSPETAAFRTHFLDIFERLLGHYGIDASGRDFLCEGLLEGAQVTVEGWRSRDAGGILGVVDSTFEPGTRSFTRFDYPSALPPAVQERMGDIALRVAERLGLEHTLFNVELTWDPATERIGIIEINPRVCGQFADLYQKVDGTHGYEVAFALATGRAPRPRRRAGPFAAAASFPLRVFEPALVRRVPSEEELRTVERAHPGTVVWIECEPGERLLRGHGGDAPSEDETSHRYAVINLGGTDRADLSRRLERVQTELGLEIEPCAPAGSRPTAAPSAPSA
jgi:hypothetical protein